MVSKKISDLSPGSALTGTEQFPSALTGANYRHTAAQVKTYVLSTQRETLTASRTYYVRTDGSDSNTGLTDSAGGAFLTIQRACDAISTDIDQNGYSISVNIGAGTHSGFALQGSMPPGTRDDRVLQFSAGVGLDNGDVHIDGVTYVQGVRVQFTDIDFQLSIWCEPFTEVTVVDCRFSGFGWLYIRPFANVHFNGETIIESSGVFQFLFFDGGPSQVVWDGTVVLNSPDWSQAFIRLDGAGTDTGGGNTVQWAVSSVTGTGTGKKFTVGYNNYLVAFPPGVLSAIPGDVAGVYGVLKSFATTVTALPSAATSGAGARFFVTDANSTTFLATAVGGGANAVPVVSNGTNWVIG